MKQAPGPAFPGGAAGALLKEKTTAPPSAVYLLLTDNPSMTEQQARDRLSQMTSEQLRVSSRFVSQLRVVAQLRPFRGQELRRLGAEAITRQLEFLQANVFGARTPDQDAKLQANTVCSTLSPIACSAGWLLPQRSGWQCRRSWTDTLQTSR
jgi:hypothetical protein